SVRHAWSMYDIAGIVSTLRDGADGAAVFIILFACAIVVGSALSGEFKYQPRLWVHAVLWLPWMLAVTLWPLRAMKSLLIALQFHHKAAEGRLIQKTPE